MSTIKSNPMQYLFPKVRREILDLLFSQPRLRWHLRDIQRRTGCSVSAVRRELEALAQSGILIQTKDGNRTYYQPDTHCPVFPELQGLVRKTGGLTVLLRQALEPLADEIFAAFIYGSIATGKAVNSSDIDIMIIGTCTFKHVVHALHDAQQQAGREINPSVYPPDEFAQKARDDQHYITKVLNEPKIILIGDEHELERLAKK